MKKTNEDAVSPVVGVMLMLVVTIIIAAVVSAFAGGLGSAQERAPMATIDVDIVYGTGTLMDPDVSNIIFTLVSGDPIPTKDLSIITYYTNDNGVIYRHEQTSLSPVTDLYGDPMGWGRSYGRVPFINDMRYGYAGNNPLTDFGNYTWMTGDVLCTQGTPGTADLLGINNTADPHGYADNDFGRGSVVDVKILHIPSQKYLYDQEVVVV